MCQAHTAKVCAKTVSSSQLCAKHIRRKFVLRHSADRMFSDAFPTFSLPPTSAGTTTIRPKFVEGTVYQLAKVLYELQVGQETQPAIAIQEALKTFGHDSDRSPIVQDARSSAEALNRKRILLFNTTKSHPTTTVFEQAENTKKTSYFTYWQETRKNSSTKHSRGSRTGRIRVFHRLERIRKHL